MQNCSLTCCCSHVLSELYFSELSPLSSSPINLYSQPRHRGEQRSSRHSPAEEAGLISQEQEEHRGGKLRYTGDQLKPMQVSGRSVCTLCLADFGLHSQPFSINGIFCQQDDPYITFRTSLCEAIVLPVWDKADSFNLLYLLPYLPALSCRVPHEKRSVDATKHQHLMT